MSHSSHLEYQSYVFIDSAALLLQGITRSIRYVGDITNIIMDIKWSVIALKGRSCVDVCVTIKPGEMPTIFLYTVQINPTSRQRKWVKVSFWSLKTGPNRLRADGPDKNLSGCSTWGL